MNPQELLDEYSDNLLGIELITSEKQTLIDSILTPEIKAKIDEIEAEFEPKLEALNTRNSIIKDTVQSVVLSIGKPISGKFHVMKFYKGRVTWDTDKLDGYAAAHPEILVFKKTGNSYTALMKRTDVSDAAGKADRKQYSSLIRRSK